MPFAGSYLKNLKQRGKDSHVYRKYQLMGLEVAQILEDEKHKSLYIKLAKEHGGERMMRLAKDVAERKTVKNKGAYFMKMLSMEKMAMVTARTAVTAATAGTAAPKKIS